MPSSTSSSPASPDRHETPLSALQHRWPTLILLPVLVALLGAAAIAPLIEMFLGEHFGLSGGRDAPWPWALALLGLAAFWCGRLLESGKLSSKASSTAAVVCGAIAIVLWWVLEPNYDPGALLSDPISLVNENGYLITPLLIGIGVWVQGLRYAYDPGHFSAEEIRGSVRRSWLILGGTIVFAAMIGGNIGNAGIAAARLAVPLAMIASAGAVAAAEMESTRRLAFRRGSTAPGWERFGRLFAGLVVAILLLTGVVALFLGPGVLEAVVAGMSAVFRAFGTLLLWFMYAVVYVLYIIYRVIAWVVNAIFGDILGPMEPPDLGQQTAGPEQEMMEPVEGEGTPYATLLRWIGLIIGLIIAVAIIFYLARPRKDLIEDIDADEERTSIFSASLARQQLRDLFRRKPKAERPRKLNLESTPGSVREAMLYLQVLATRQYVGRRESETPADFARRLAKEWPAVDGPLQELRTRYEIARYGETEIDRNRAIDAWRAIWSHRKDAVVQAPPDMETT